MGILHCCEPRRARRVTDGDDRSFCRFLRSFGGGDGGEYGAACDGSDPVRYKLQFDGGGCAVLEGFSQGFCASSIPLPQEAWHFQVNLKLLLAFLFWCILMDQFSLTFSGAKFKEVKFDKTGNFGLWQTRVKVLLVQQEILKALRAKKPDVMEDEDWEELQQQAAATIHLCLANK
ncbi:uncharacterized protein LOC110036813, partial [Phalaenopsis equestris]|uniref:uncharacterized protein LOC110036813 n=1 Tax=Phalaenopsis equestris TaxID=78828 RepID=UPI0009E1E1D9